MLSSQGAGLFTLSHDFLEVANDTNSVGNYCGAGTPKAILLPGSYVELKFHTDEELAYRGFAIFFAIVPNGGRYFFYELLVFTHF